jgi:uncharacterized linocin/CFP29 family protein
MNTNYLLREDAPIKEQTWQALDETMVAAAKGAMTGRRLLSIQGPYGLGLKSVSLGDSEAKAGVVSGNALPLSLLHMSFSMSQRDLAAFERDGTSLDTANVASAAIEMAALEDSIIFKGTKEVPGLSSAKNAHEHKLGQWSQAGAATEDVIKAVTLLDKAGFHGPYSLALEPSRYNALMKLYPGMMIGELENIKSIVAEGIVKAPAIQGGGLLLGAGAQFASIVIGQDMSLGYIGPMNERIQFSISESLALYVRQPLAICVLRD